MAIPFIKERMDDEIHAGGDILEGKGEQGDFTSCKYSFKSVTGEAMRP